MLMGDGDGDGDGNAAAYVVIKLEKLSSSSQLVCARMNARHTQTYT